MAATITINNYTFAPSTLTVAPGATVTVKNIDKPTHTVTASPPHKGAFDTSDIAPGQTKVFRAPTTPGEYPYHCSVHPFMHGTLIVR
ncbi:MAG: cupredoxin domain-containing protein [Acidimicrobiales bacterium]